MMAARVNNGLRFVLTVRQAVYVSVHKSGMGGECGGMGKRGERRKREVMEDMGRGGGEYWGRGTV